jgi:hypothetical protein
MSHLENEKTIAEPFGDKDVFDSAIVSVLPASQPDTDTRVHGTETVRGLKPHHIQLIGELDALVVR